MPNTAEEAGLSQLLVETQNGADTLKTSLITYFCLKYVLIYDPAIVVLSIYSRGGEKHYVHTKNLHMNVYSLFIITQTENSPNVLQK